MPRWTLIDQFIEYARANDGGGLRRGWNALALRR